MLEPAVGAIQKSFRRSLAAQGLHYTHQRGSILSQILSGRSHFDVDELYLKLRRKEIRVSRATLYRTISHLADMGYLRKVDLDPSHAHYELASGSVHHEHLICERCGRIVEFTDPLLERRIEEAFKNHGFVMTRHTVQVFGVCEECRNAGSGT